MFTTAIVSGLTAMILALIVGKIVIKNGSKLGIVDDPSLHKHPKVVHTFPVPRGGGIVIAITILVSSLIFIPIDKRLIGILAGVLILGVVGFLDDRFEEKISPYTRLAVNALAALLVIGAGIGISYITNPLGGIINFNWVLADLFALVWLVWMQNIVGWSSGVDGQLPGFVVIAALTMAALSLRFATDGSQTQVIILSLIVAGAYLGFGYWNWFPQKMMPGYGGKSIAGFCLGVLAILSGAKVGAMMIVLGVPFIDAALVIFKRLREGRNPVWGGYEHLHHMLLARGWGKKRIAIFYSTISAVMAILALNLNSSSKYFTMAAVVLLITGGVLWLQNFSTISKLPDPDNGSKT
ncbi:MAG: Undecaprenyl-phosphate alpha-N-acetylglucosaminyltransferase [Candidatus Amesbacteria bacterium GW2011_GWA2_42_12]|uniref:Undecaprenyl-phosphate alpha-N-acetylglucosaminyltransferase n=1 Tax=Candidatus Amesbacteria bacterium GW2011_GWA2_42_12 TaxID=1618356 RepID=A0A0G0Y902_9BACT|nr:MAG: Undecaprenyl-phosphate alpha-N-acetylglucosaminyltransferase [Candidatus Amesbacteria bacterium GW2011_GWA2_42_12]